MADSTDERETLTQPTTQRRVGDIPLAAFPDLEPGCVLSGTYELKRILGQGAMGVVWLARDRRLSRDVAIKLALPTLTASPMARRQFEQEARTLARVDSPHVVKVYAFGEAPQGPFFVMEYVPGQTVHDWLNSFPDARADLDLAFDILDQICRGVSAIHAEGTVHRDLKPTNVLLAEGLLAKVADFGLASSGPIAPGSSSGTALVPACTPWYVAPEVALGAVDDALQQRVDVYGLGVLAFEVLTGRLPFDGDAIQVISQHLNARPPSAHTYRPELPRDLDWVLHAALAKNPVERTPSAEALRQALHSLRSSSSLPARGQRFVLADDDPDFRAFVAAIVASGYPGASLVEVADGDAATDCATRQRTDLVVLDCMMPGPGPEAVVQAIRAHKLGMRTAIVICTATAGGPEWQRLSAAGADAFVVKPCDPSDLLRVVGRVLTQRARRIAHVPGV